MEETTTSTLENVNNALNDRLLAMEARISENEGNIASLGLIAFFGIAFGAISGLAIWSAIDSHRDKQRQLEGRVDRIADVQSENVNIANHNADVISKREKRFAKALTTIGGKKAAEIIMFDDDDNESLGDQQRPRKW
jgi:hypothetical protein